ncbi:MAG: hypothetical protein FWH12_01920 [Treponema sp.]|nr:hypothetical protein [Treponema sp.]
MLDRLHEHILDELRINARSDTKFILSAIIINFTSLAVNAALSNAPGLSQILIMFCFVTLTIAICVISLVGLVRGRQASKKLISGLVEMYRDNGVQKYYDVSLLDHYKLRYNMFILAILFTGFIAIIVPFINASLG